MKRSKAIWIFGFGVLILVTVFWEYQRGFVFSTAGLRVPTDQENFFHEVAYDFDIPELCEKISTSAWYYGGFSMRPYLERSWCYFHVASKYQNPSLCEYVQPISSFLLNGSNISASECMKTATSQDYDNVGPPITSTKVLIETMKDLGYKPGLIQMDNWSFPLEENGDSYFSFYNTLRLSSNSNAERQKFIQKVKSTFLSN